MYKSKTQIRVRYAETDQMGYVYYGNYAAYYEVARVESLRQLGLSYRDLEKEGRYKPGYKFTGNNAVTAVITGSKNPDQVLSNSSVSDLLEAFAMYFELACFRLFSPVNDPYIREEVLNKFNI